MKKVEVTYYCDRCGSAIEGAHFRIKPHSYDNIDKEQLNDYLFGALEREYCDPCMKEIMAFAAQTASVKETASGKSDVPHGTEEPKRKQIRVTDGNKNKARPLDDGKIYALRNAGWEWPKIKEELGTDVSLNTLAYHYEKEKARRETLKVDTSADPHAWMDEIDDDDIDI